MKNIKLFYFVFAVQFGTSLPDVLEFSFSYYALEFGVVHCCQSSCSWGSWGSAEPEVNCLVAVMGLVKWQPRLFQYREAKSHIIKASALCIFNQKNKVKKI